MCDLKLIAEQAEHRVAKQTQYTLLNAMEEIFIIKKLLAIATPHKAEWEGFNSIC